MSRRLENFHNFAANPMLGNDLKRLTVAERQECEQFIKEHEHLNNDDFADAINRWKLDKPELRGKRHVIMWGLILQANAN